MNILNDGSQEFDSLSSAHGENSMNQPIVEDLVTASHILANEGVLDGLGHISVRHPTTGSVI
jgi:hypothetical protein